MRAGGKAAALVQTEGKPVHVHARLTLERRFMFERRSLTTGSARPEGPGSQRQRNACF